MLVKIVIVLFVMVVAMVNVIVIMNDDSIKYSKKVLMSFVVILCLGFISFISLFFIIQSSENMKGCPKYELISEPLYKKVK